MANESREVEYMETYFPGKAIKFVYGEAHNAISIDGDPIGSQQGGDSFPKSTFVEKDDCIASVTMGLSTWQAEGAFTGLTLEKRKSRSEHHEKRHALKRVLVGASLVHPSWTYDSRKLGLNLAITTLAAPHHKPVARYAFTMSSDESLEFNPHEFDRFWDW